MLNIFVCVIHIHCRSALRNTTEMLQKVKSLNAQMIASFSDMIE